MQLQGLRPLTEISRSAITRWPRFLVMIWDRKNLRAQYDLSQYNIVAVGVSTWARWRTEGLNVFNTRYVLALPETAH